MIREEEERDESGLPRTYMLGCDISLMVQRVQAAQTVCSIACVQCGSDYLNHAFNYIHTELSVVRNSLWDLEQKIKTGKGAEE